MGSILLTAYLGELPESVTAKHRTMNPPVSAEGPRTLSFPVGLLHGAGGHILSRIASSIAVLAVVSVATFGLTSLLPGDPTTFLLPAGAPAGDVAGLRNDLNLDSPVPQRFVHWLAKALGGDLGAVYRTHEPVTEAILRTLPVTAQLVFSVQFLALVLGVAVGVRAARGPGSRFDRLSRFGSFSVMAIPSFAVALALVFLFAVHLRWLPAVGFVRFGDDPSGNIRSLVLPTITMALPAGARYSRLVRIEMMTTLQGNHVQLARAMGIPERRIAFRHALRQSLLSVLTLFSLEFGLLFGGAVLVERVFAMPGLGSLFLESIGRREYVAVQGIVLTLAVIVVLCNLLGEIARSLLDPRIRVPRSSGA